MCIEEKNFLTNGYYLFSVILVGQDVWDNFKQNLKPSEFRSHLLMTIHFSWAFGALALTLNLNFPLL